MATAANTELVEQFEQFFRDYYRDEIGDLARQFPTDKRSLYVDWQDLYRFDPDLADDYLSQPQQLREHAEEALRVYDLPVDVKLGGAHVRIRNLPESTEIRGLRSQHVNTLVSVQGIVRKATDVRPKIQEAAFECQRCGTLTRVPQTGADYQEPHECQGCERQGPFRLNVDQSEFVDAQQIRVQESPEGLRGGETPRSIDVKVEDDLTGEVTPGDHVTVTGILRLDQSGGGNNQDRSPVFDTYVEGVAVEIEEEQFEDMEITEEDKKEIIKLSEAEDIYDRMVGSIAPSIYGYEQQKLAIVLQLFSGVTKHLADGTRIRGDLHMLLIGDPGTGKCVRGDTKVTLADGRERAIRELVEENLENPTPIDDGVYDTVDLQVPSLAENGSLTHQRATKVWKREAPERMYRIRTEGGKEVEVTPSHPLFVDAGDGWKPVRAEDLRGGTPIATRTSTLPDGGTTVPTPGDGTKAPRVGPEVITSIERVDPDYDWVYDLEVDGTHSYLSNDIVSHNSQLLQYVQQISPRSVYTSGKGSSAAGLTASAVRDDFGDGQQWTLEAGALVLADQGIAAVDELDKMRCVTGETLVRTGERSLVRIGDLARRAASAGSIESLPNGRTIRDVDVDAWTMTDEGRIVRRPVTAIHEYEAPETLREVTLESGESVTATPDHPFFVLEEGKRVEKAANELDGGDWVYVPQRLPSRATDGGSTVTDDASPNEPRFVDEDSLSPAHGAVLGYVAGDGNVFYDRGEGSYGIRFTNKEEQLRTHFEDSCQEAFGVEPTRPPSEQRDDGVETVRLTGKEYVDELLAAGTNLETYDGKCLPEGITHGDRETKAAFVRALADSEGHVDDRNVRIVSSSYALLLGVKTLLLEFDVTSQIQTEEREDGRDIHKLAITAADSLEAFRRHIGFTLDRKRESLGAAVEATSGDRTILDVIPGCGELLAETRDSLRLYQSECGIVPATYCNFEDGDANISLHRAKVVLDRFEERRKRAMTDVETLDEPCSWEQLEAIKDRYHVAQRELADGTEYTQQQVSRLWGIDPELQTVVRRRLGEVVSGVAETDLEPLRTLARGDVKWRRVANVERVDPTAGDDRIPILRHEVADLIGGPEHDAVERGRELLDGNPTPGSWNALRSELDRWSIPLQRIAERMDVAGSTVSRWFNGVVDVDNFEIVRDHALELIEERRDELKALIDEIDDRRERKVYDLTVEGTHNFLANGMIVHNSEDRSAMHQALEQQSYHPDTEILLADGRRVAIGQLVDGRMAADPEGVVDGVDCEILPVEDLRVHSTDLESGETTKLPVDRVSRHEAPDAFVRVRFSNGREVVVTPEHPTFVDDGGEVGTVEARDLEAGAFVPAPRKLPNSSAPVELADEPHRGKEKDVTLPDELTGDLAELLGFLVAEGHSYVGSVHEVGFSNQDERLLERVDRLAQSVFGMESYDTTNAAGTVTRRWISTKLYRWFEGNFPEVMHTARDKRIPTRVLGGSEEHVRRFLVGAFQGDGGVESEAMSYSTASEGLARDYADALAKIGVASRIHHDAAEDSWKVYVMGDSVERFVEAVVDPADDRYEQARAFVERSNETPRHHDVLPTSAAREIRDLRGLLGLRLTGQFRPNLDENYGVQIETVRPETETLEERLTAVREALASAASLGDVRSAIGWSGRELAERLDGETSSSIHYAEDGGYDPERRERLAERARETIQDALTDAERRIEKLRRRTDLRYYRVTDVETVPNEGEYATDWVYDVTVEPTNTFVSQGVVLHNSISISKAGINATLKSRCSLLGAANPKYGRFDQYEPIAEQIELEPALISRFDLIFTVTDEPDEEEDRRLAEHILTTNYAGELNTQRQEMTSPDVSREEVESIVDEVDPVIDPELLRKYVAYAKQTCHPRMTDGARETIKDFYTELRASGSDEDAPVPVTARKLEALVRLAEASARIRLSDRVTEADAQRVTDIVRSSLEDVGMDPESGELDADIVEAGTSKTQRDRIQNIKGIVEEIQEEYEEGAPKEVVLDRATEVGIEESKAEREIEKLKERGELYETRTDHFRVV